MSFSAVSSAPGTMPEGSNKYSQKEARETEEVGDAPGASPLYVMEGCSQGTRHRTLCHPWNNWLQFPMLKRGTALSHLAHMPPVLHLLTTAPQAVRRGHSYRSCWVLPALCVSWWGTEGNKRGRAAAGGWELDTGML